MFEISSKNCDLNAPISTEQILGFNATKLDLIYNISKNSIATTMLSSIYKNFDEWKMFNQVFEKFVIAIEKRALQMQGVWAWALSKYLTRIYRNLATYSQSAIPLQADDHINFGFRNNDVPNPNDDDRV